MGSKLTIRPSSYLTLIAVLLLPACAAFPGLSPQDGSGPGTESAQINYLPTDAKSIQDDRVGNDAYHLMVAEMAFRQGNVNLAVEHYLIVAKSQSNPAIADRALRIAIYAENFEAAIVAAERRLELSPDNLEAQQVVIAIYIRQGEITEATRYLDNMISNSQVSDQTLFGNLLGLLAREKNAEATLDVTRQTAHNYPQKAYAQYLHAMLSAQVGLADEALVYLDRSLELQVIDGVHSARAKILLKLGRSEEAVVSLSQAVAEQPDDKNIRLTYARLLVDVKQYEEARSEFEILYQQSPNDPDLLYTLGLLSLESQRLDDAEKYMARLVELNLREGEAQYYLGRIYEGKKQPNQAIDWYRMVQAEEYRFDAQLRVAALLGATDRIDKAREHLSQMRKGSQASSALVRIYMTEGEILGEAERFAEAKEVYDTALKFSPGNIDLLFARGMVAERMGRLDILEADINAVLKIQPNNAHALNALGFTLADQTDRYEEAYDLLKRAVELMPDNAAILDSFGWVNYRLGHYDTAIRLLRSALSRYYDSEIAAHLGEVLWVSGNKKEAKDVWNDALKKIPNDPRIQQVMQRLTK
jgi:tetratricopeptide (TPR) repeat protein